MEIVLLIIRLVLFAVFALAAVGKFLDRDGARKAFGDFGVPSALHPALAIMLPAVEIAIAFLLLFTGTSWFGAIGASGLLFVFTAGMVYQTAIGNAPDCHCFGQIHSEPVGISTIGRNALLLMMAVFLVVQGRAVQGVSIADGANEIAQLTMIALAVVLLTAIVFAVTNASKVQQQILDRLEVLETHSHGEIVERDDVGHPHEGLPIGALFPEFDLASLDGARVSAASLLSAQRPVLFIFVSPNCTPCKGLLPEIAEWDRELSSKMDLILITSGDEEENRAKFGDISSRVLLQKNRELADAVKAQWTPTALLMDRNGRIASHVAAGDGAIRGFVEQLKGDELESDFTHFANFNGHSHPNRIGTDVPAFDLVNIEGEKITSADLKGKKTLVAFWSLTCGYCDAMIEDLRNWDKTRGVDEPELLVLLDVQDAHDGDLALDSPVLIDTGHKRAVEFGMYGTPSAVLVNEDGKIVSETAVGAPDIWSLIGKRK